MPEQRTIVRLDLATFNSSLAPKSVSVPYLVTLFTKAAGSCTGSQQKLWNKSYVTHFIKMNTKYCASSQFLTNSLLFNVV